MQVAGLRPMPRRRRCRRTHDLSCDARLCVRFEFSPTASRLARMVGMTAPGTDLSSSPATERSQWERISEAEARIITNWLRQATMPSTRLLLRWAPRVELRPTATGPLATRSPTRPDPSPMALDWRALRVTGSARSAIYDEVFPADLAKALRPFPDEVAAAFDQEAALAVLVTFATHWPELRPDGPGRTDFIGLRRHPTARVEGILVFYAIEVAPGQVVITNVAGHRIDR